MCLFIINWSLFCFCSTVGNMGLYSIYILQEGCVCNDEPRNPRMLIKSLLSGSESKGKRRGVETQLHTYSRLYLMRSDVDSASLTIDYSKGVVENGAVYISRRPVSTPASSPSPLRWALSSGGNCFSLKPHTDATTNRKLNLPLDKALSHPRLKDVVLTPSALSIVIIGGFNRRQPWWMIQRFCCQGRLLMLLCLHPRMSNLVSHNLQELGDLYPSKVFLGNVSS